ncbi:hypothetical protein AALO_G00115370 [Alosa alosa]|uniref:BAAT/Acyl-CoA thioester hydrolase C-terminal domain-containing protein n=1 Tax=Alosa alosa TaxID=278164 RepID=A0AAV6GPX6_9TELE|nr:hypothetical protein AALO_G00115370 [Alosa alosa]
MALAYYGHKDLPEALNKLDLEYFEKAVTLLRTHPKVKGPDIGILSISKDMVIPPTKYDESKAVDTGYGFLDAAQWLRDHGKENFEVIRYHKAGHFLEVPYMPHCPITFHPAIGAVVAFGGEPQAHAEAQVDLWKRVPEFFKKHLNNDHSDFKAML